MAEGRNIAPEGLGERGERGGLGLQSKPGYERARLSEPARPAAGHRNKGDVHLFDVPINVCVSFFLERYGIVDLAGWSALSGFGKVADFQQAHRQWVEDALATDAMARDDRWSESIAVGSAAFVERVKLELGIKAKHREIGEAGGAFALWETRVPYTPIFGAKSGALRPDNTLLREESLESTEA